MNKNILYGVAFMFLHFAFFMNLCYCSGGKIIIWLIILFPFSFYPICFDDVSENLLIKYYSILTLYIFMFGVILCNTVPL